VICFITMTPPIAITKAEMAPISGQGLGSTR
jgi:hypothetical protein